MINLTKQIVMEIFVIRVLPVSSMMEKIAFVTKWIDLVQTGVEIAD